MDLDDATRQLIIAVQDPQNGPRQILSLAAAGADLNDCRHPHTHQHPIFLAIACHHMGIVNVLVENGVRFDHRDPKHHDASVIQRLRSLQALFQETVDSQNHKATHGIAKRRLAATESAIKIYDDQVARGEIAVVPDVAEPSHEEVMQKLQEMMRSLANRNSASAVTNQQSELM